MNTKRCLYSYSFSSITLKKKHVCMCVCVSHLQLSKATYNFTAQNFQNYLSVLIQMRIATNT
jgi:hypothetical protein